MSTASALLEKKPREQSELLKPALTVAGESLKAVNALILTIVENEIPLIQSTAEHIIASGGKRLRPLLTLLSSQALDIQNNRHIRLAAAVEFIHTATLLHDDVVDESKLRRGLATANEVFGNKVSVLVGDFLLSQSFRLMVEDGTIEVLDILSRAAAVISQGEVLQMTVQGDVNTSIETYYDIINAKTAALFEAACEISPIITGKPEYRPVFARFGNALGLAFQIVDDLLDYSANQQTLGKTVGDDFREGKLTLPVLLACQKANAEEKQFWERTMGDREQKDGDFEHAMELMQKHKVLAELKTIVHKHCDEARSALAQLPPTPAKDALGNIVDFCETRVF